MSDSGKTALDKHHSAARHTVDNGVPHLGTDACPALATAERFLRDGTARWLPTRPWLVILLAGFCSRMIFALWLQPWDDRQRYELERVALSLANSGVLGNPYAIETGPSAHIAPIYAFLLAAIFTIFGSGVTGEVVKVCVSTLLSVIPFTLFPRLARSLGLSVRLGFWTGLLASLVPWKPGSDLLGDWEAPAAAALLVLCMIGIAETWRHGQISPRRAARLGFCWGISVLTVPAFLSIYLASLLTGTLLFLRSSPGAWLRFAAVQTAVAGLLVLPWPARNWMELGSPIVTRSNTGLELRLSNNDFAGPSEFSNFRAGVYHRFHPLQNASEAKKVRDVGEVAYNRDAQDQAVEWIKSNPSEFLRLSIGRAFLFWFPKSDPIRSVLFSLLSLASIAGTALLLKRDVRAGLVLLVPLLVQPLPHYLVHVNVRHKYPIDWIGVIGVAIVIQACAHRARKTAVTGLPSTLAVAERGEQ